MSLFQPEQLRPPISADEWADLTTRMRACSECPFRATATQVVPGAGCFQRPTIAVVGESPGQTDDVRGEPFVGPAGQVLDALFQKARIPKTEVFRVNVLGCRPPGGRTPDPSERAKCYPWLQKQLRLVNPKIILALGSSAAQQLLGYKREAAELRGEWWDWEGIPLRVTFHPAWLLKSAPDRKQAWLDMTAILRRLGRSDQER